MTANVVMSGGVEVANNRQSPLKRLGKALLARVPFKLRYDLFYHSARSLGINVYQAHGSAGPIFGPLYDQVVMKNYLRDRRWSEDIAQIISAVFAGSGGTYYDIGANIGTVLLQIAKNPQVACVGFEPEPRNFALLSANVAFQGAANVTLKNVAVADRACQRHFTTSEWNSGDHRLSAGGGYLVNCIGLDELPAPRKYPFAVKIDTQGAEPEIFIGGEKVLATADLIIAEYWPSGMARLGQRPDAMLEFARRHFRRGYIIDPNKPVSGPEPIAEIIAKLARIPASGSDADQADLVLVK